MRRINARIPTDEEFEAIILSMGCDIVEVVNRGGDEYYLMNLSGYLVEVPATSCWRIREVAQCLST